MRFKAKKPIKRTPVTYPVDPNDILATWYIKKEWGEKQVVMTTAQINKFCFLANARVLSKPMPDGFIIMGAFLDEKSRDTAIANIRALSKNAAMMECPIPATRDAGFGPLALAAPPLALKFAMVMTAMDPMALEYAEELLAERMDTADGKEGFLFPDLSPEQYKAVQERKNKKPQ